MRIITIGTRPLLIFYIIWIVKAKKPGYRSQLFGPLKLYREEIEELVTLFTNSCERGVELADEKYVFDSLEEMENRLGKNISYLSISGRDPYTTVEVGAKKIGKWGRKDQNYIYAGEEDKAQVLFLKTRDILQDHKRWILSRIFSWPIVILVSAVDYAFALPPLLHVHLFPSIGATLRISVAVLFMAYFAFLTYFLAYGKSYLSLESRNKRQSFLVRNRDAILLLLLGAGAAEAIHWLGSRLSH